ncbi:Heterogeneous nuclear ribonucleoprotein M [Monoraphidium neglectum]|uniref:Heterogeneous nuclear ribonucleoprotein M n=1 Tax=Monoraphidium neglectum TaxID=145388 RepID=A0A0D2LAX7_9CHLO|nr:Heterogeneous nuclear ribonucleoprotein M [Monoraphidium neglectum]KIZ03939.1 Heterogeneous nuclear ribonucleoprotein M [Monoraphidium neglectum]|eukprot:XP_013902958.1 Heterogeneous nuclear ribonucleoprotein M [Monoraphidium neglectum]
MAEGEEGVMRIGRRCYVSNLAWRTSWQDLKDKFRECGNVVYANVTRGDDGRSKGWGIVEFETPDEAIAAVNTLNGVDLGGRRISIVVQGIPWKFTWQDLKDLFTEIGDVERADVMQAPDGRSKGWGTVRFLSKEAAQSAIDSFHGSDLEGRTLTVFLDKKA